MRGISKKQEIALKNPCPDCGNETRVVGDLADFKHDFVICNSERCRWNMMFDGTRCE